MSYRVFKKDDQDQVNEEKLLHRIKNALVLLSDGHPFKVGDLTFSCDNKDNFSVSGWIESYELKT